MWWGGFENEWKCGVFEVRWKKRGGGDEVDRVDFSSRLRRTARRARGNR
jgi:hypothetical protein